jgi:hypothetical protein
MSFWTRSPYRTRLDNVASERVCTHPTSLHTGVGVAVAVGVAVGLDVFVGVAVGEQVDVAVAVGTRVAVGVAVARKRTSKERVEPAEVTLRILSPPASPLPRKLEGFVVSLMAVRPTSLEKWALSGSPFADTVPAGRYR